MKTELSRECLLSYCWSEALWLMLGAWLCLPLLILAWWHHSLSEQVTCLQMQWRKTVQHQLVLQPEKPSFTVTERDWLYSQLVLLDGVFGAHVRLQAVEWKGGLLTIQGEADSVFNFSQAWDNFEKQSKNSKSQLDSYGYKEWPFFKATITRFE